MSGTKQGVFADAGRKGARKRWGEPRILRLDTLEPPYRRLILAMVEAAKAAPPAGQE
jgi:hypothetical protein